MNNPVFLAHAANDVLREYMVVHDDVFGGSLWKSIRRILPIPGIFDAIPYPRHAEHLARLHDELGRVEAAAGAASRSGASDIPQTRFLRELEKYCHSLGDTILRLHTICAGLARKAEGLGGPTLAAYKESVARYEKSCEEYVKMGARLNTAFRAFQKAD